MSAREKVWPQRAITGVSSRLLESGQSSTSGTAATVTTGGADGAAAREELAGAIEAVDKASGDDAMYGGGWLLRNDRRAAVEVTTEQ